MPQSKAFDDLDDVDALLGQWQTDIDAMLKSRDAVDPNVRDVTIQDLEERGRLGQFPDDEAFRESLQAEQSLLGLQKKNCQAAQDG